MAVFDDHEQDALNNLYEAILTLKTPEELHSFFSDLMSYNEMCSMLHRWQILLLIDQGKSYEEIIKELAPPSSNEDSQSSDKGKRDTRKGKGRNSTKVSSTTISRVKTCYNNEYGGYRTALNRLKNERSEEI